MKCIKCKTELNDSIKFCFECGEKVLTKIEQEEEKKKYGYSNSKKYSGIQLYKKKNEDIAYSFRYTDVNGKTKRMQVGLKSSGITEQYTYNKRMEYLNTINLGENPKNVKLKRKKIDIVIFDNVASKYYDKSTNKTANELRRKYENHIKPYLGDKIIDDITTSDIEDIQKLKSEKLAPKTVNGIINEISAIFNFAIKNKIVNSNPANGKAIDRASVDNTRDKFLDNDEILELFEAVKEDEQIYLFCLLALNTGCRVSSARLIKRQDIDLVNKLITLKDTKNDNTYRGFIENEELFTILSRRKRELKTNEFLLSYGYKDIKDIIKQKLQPILNNLFNEGLETNDRKNRTVPHTLRHTFASHLAINGVSIFKIKELMNHKTIEMTMRYAKLSPEAGREEVKGLSFC
jgi:integrase